MFENISGYDNWKLQSQEDNDLCECGHCKEIFEAKELIWSGKMDLCPECYENIEEIEFELQD